MGLHVAATAAFILGCGGQRTDRAAEANAPAWFADRAAETGLVFQHINGMSGQRYMAEILAPGVALFDMDNDGDLDIYVPQGYVLGGPSTTSRGRLYRLLLVRRGTPPCLDEAGGAEAHFANDDETVVRPSQP